MDERQQLEISGSDECPDCTWHEKIVCKLCKFETKSKRKIWQHIQKEHNMDNAQYKAKCGPPQGNYVNEKCNKHKGLATGSSKNNEQSRLSDGTNKDGRMQYLVSQWANQCVYRCGECQKEFKSFKTLVKSHLKDHQLTKPEYVARHGDRIYEKVYHKCSICEKKVLQNFDYIVKHLKSFHHKIDIFLYYQLQKTNVAIDKDLINDSKISHSVVRADKEIKHEVHFEHVSKQILFESWTQYKPLRGEFERCKLCQRGVWKNSTFFGMHLNKTCDKNKEKLDLFQYFILYVLPIYESASPKLDHVYGNPQDVTQHDVNQSNNFGLANLFSEQYQASTSYNVSGFEIETTNIDESICESQDNDLPEIEAPEETCDINSFPSAPFERNNSVTNTNKLSMGSKSISNTQVQSGHIREKTVSNNSSPDVVPSDASTSINETLDAYYNMCRYECPICKEHLKSENKFRLHVIHKHSISEEKYKVDYPNPFPMTIVNWECKKCGHVDRHDATPIQKHLKKAHKLDLKDYFDSYSTSDEK